MSLVRVRFAIQNRLKIRNQLGHTYYAGDLNSDSVVVDLGANRGEFSKNLTAAHGCKCYAVEPVKVLFEKIPQMDRLSRYNIALGDKDGPVNFYPSDNPEAGTIFLTTSTKTRPIVVEGRRFTSFLKENGLASVDLLKVDIEGAEGPLFDSTPDETLRDIKQITVEFHDFLEGVINPAKVRAIVRRLESLGFLYVDFTGGQNHSDCLFINLKAIRPAFHPHVLLYLVLLKWYFGARTLLKKVLKPAKRYIWGMAEITFLKIRWPKLNARFLKAVRAQSACGIERLVNLRRLAEFVLQKGVLGDIVECGVYKGGSATLLADTIKRDAGRKIWLYDSFQGLPPATAEDGARAQEYTGRLVGDEKKVRELLLSAKIPQGRVIIRKGFFAETFREPLPEKVGFLHIDADWYDSVLLCLKVFYPRLSEGGIVLLDDFGDWEGARKALYAFCHREGIEPLLERSGLSQAFWVKGKEHNRPNEAA